MTSHHQIEHISYSQYTTYSKCPRSWYLSKVRDAEPKQTWYLPIGTAVHQMIEAHLSPATAGLELKPEGFFYPLIEQQLLIEPDTSKWLAGGPEGHPITEERALQRVTECFEKAVRFLEDIDVWGVEYDASGRLPGLEVPIIAYVDIVGEHKTKGPVILDWKTGSTKPDNFQLQTYAALLYRGDNTTGLGRYDWHGRYCMLSPSYGSETRYVDLSNVSPEEIGSRYQEVYEGVKDKIYSARQGFNCGFCFNQDNCLVRSGPTARTLYYDKSEEDGFPF